MSTGAQGLHGVLEGERVTFRDVFVPENRKGMSVDRP